MAAKRERTRPQDGDWRDVPGFEGRYMVCADGRVWSVHYNRLITGTVDNNGYMRVNREVGRVHQMVASAFVPGSGPVVRHLDGNPRNNHHTNLAWGTRADNAADAKRHGTLCNQNTFKTHCIRGHEFTEENTYRVGRYRQCRKCRRELNRQRYQAKRSQGVTL